MLTVILAAVIVSQAPAKPAAVDHSNQAAQERSVAAARKIRRAFKDKAAADRAFKAAVAQKEREEEYEQARIAQARYEHAMGPIWAAQHANEIQAQRNALIAQANAIAKYRADYEIWLQMQQNSINAQIAVQNQRR